MGIGREHPVDGEIARLGVYFCAALAEKQGAGYKIPDKYSLDSAFCKAITTEEFPDIVRRNIRTASGGIVTCFEILDMLSAAGSQLVIEPDINGKCYRTSISRR